MWLLPKLTKAIPSGLAAIVAITLIVKLFGLDVTSVGDLVTGGIGAGFPMPHLPSLEWGGDALRVIVPLAITMAAIGLIESLMTLQLIDEVTETRGNSNREAAGQGLANVLCGVFQGMGGCAMIGQSMINVSSGGRGRASGISAALFLLCFVLFVPGLIELIPVAALVGVMFMVVIGTFAWSSIRILNKIPRADAFVIVLVSSVTVLTDLAIAVACGIIASALVFCWQKSQSIFCRIETDEEGCRHYHLNGPLFFGSVQSFNKLFKVEEDGERTFVDFTESRVCDHSSLEAINAVVARYRRADKELIVTGLSPDCASVIKKAGPRVLESRVLTLSGRLRQVGEL